MRIIIAIVAILLLAISGIAITWNFIVELLKMDPMWFWMIFIGWGLAFIAKIGDD